MPSAPALLDPRPRTLTPSTSRHDLSQSAAAGPQPRPIALCFRRSPLAFDAEFSSKLLEERVFVSYMDLWFDHPDPPPPKDAPPYEGEWGEYLYHNCTNVDTESPQNLRTRSLTSTLRPRFWSSSECHQRQPGRDSRLYRSCPSGNPAEDEYQIGAQGYKKWNGKPAYLADKFPS